VTKYLFKAWRGEERLWKVFWIQHLIGTAVIGLLFSALTIILVNAFHYQIPIIVFKFLAVILIVPYGILALCLLWKCAFNVHWKFLGYFCRVYVVFISIAWSTKLVRLVPF